MGEAMTVQLEHDSIVLESENAQDTVYLEHYMGKELDVTYGKDKIGAFQMTIEIKDVSSPQSD